MLRGGIEMMKHPVPRLAALHDLSGFGRTSLTIAIPVLSSMGIQVCPLPTALLSTQTGGFDDYRLFDLSDEMVQIHEHWKQLEIDFDAVYTGFLGGSRQVEIVMNFFNDFADSDCLKIVDPVMGDNGETYGPFGPDMVESMKHLVRHADIITPNTTEAALLLDESYSEQMESEEVKEYLIRLSEMGPEQVVITSVQCREAEKVSTVAAYDRRDSRFWKVDCGYIPAQYPGTGDIFASVMAGSLLQGDSLPIALDRAVQFVSLAIRTTFGYQIPQREGVLIERVLDSLHAPVVANSYELLD